MSNIKATRKRANIRTKMMEAYEAYQRREAGSMDRLLVVVREFAYLKVYHLEHDFKDFGSAETADDWAQDISIKVWQGIEAFEKRKNSTPSSFYSWVHKIAFNRSTDAFNYLQSEKQSAVPLFVNGEEEGDIVEEENPALYKGSGYSGFGFHIPASVQGVDRSICNLLLTTVQHYDKKKDEYTTRPRNYAEVGEVLGMKEDAVKQRLKRLRDRLKAERAASRPTVK